MQLPQPTNRFVALLSNLMPALVGGLCAVLAGILIRGLFDTKLLAEIVVDASTDSLQPQGFSFLLNELGPVGKPLLFASVVLGEIALYAVVWRQIAMRGHVLLAGLVAALALILATVVMVQLTEATLGSQTTWVEYILVTLFRGGVFTIIAGYTMLGLLAATQPVEDGAEVPSRRRFIAFVPVAVGAFALYIVGREVAKTGGGGIQSSAPSGEPSTEITTTSDFYIVSKNLYDPQVDAAGWTLTIGGITDQMVTFNYSDILALPAIEQYATLECISNEVGGDLMSTALFKGILMRDLLAMAGPKPDARHVAFKAADDYTESVPLEFATADGVMLAWEMNGAPLETKHGFPLRMVGPGKYGYKGPKWMTEIALMDDETLGYWQKRGWDSEGTVHTTARIDVPASGRTIDTFPYRISGVGFSGRRGISKVELSLDGGRSWQEASLKPTLSPYTWVLWQYDLTSRPEGNSIELVARATDGDGTVQTAEDTPSYPAGATGYHKVKARLGEEA